MSQRLLKPIRKNITVTTRVITPERRVAHRPVRPGRTRIVKTCAALIMLLVACGCTSTQATERKRLAAAPTLPSSLLGIWYENNADGKRSCKAYRKIKSSNDSDAVSDSLVGSLVITAKLVHAYSEYGEGNFYAVKKVTKSGNHGWKVDTLLYIDTMPSGEEYGSGAETLNLLVESGVLVVTFEGWKDERNSQRYFRCSEVSKGMHRDYADTAQ